MKLDKDLICRLTGIENIQLYETVDSTNSLSKRLITENAALPMLICAEGQSAGRGRLGRSFYSPSEDGIYMSLSFSCGCQMTDAVTVTSAAAVATAEAIDLLLNTDCRIKWVNDIYLGEKKVCGILTEAVHLGEAKIIVGIGINCTTNDFPPELQDTAGAIGSVNRSRLTAEICSRLLNYCRDLTNRSWLSEYKRRSLVLGKNISYTENGITRQALALSIDPNGGLVISDEGKLKTLSTGEISIRLSN